MRDFRKQKVWHKAHHFTLEIYRITKNFPSNEIYGIISQIRRATVSIPNNIAEGCGRNSEADLKWFFTISMGSASEVEYLFLLSNDLNYLSKTEYENLNRKIIEIKKMLSSYIVKLRPKTRLKC
ncbi:MAG: four helix bundle protein [Candidatus Cloacimonadota bacterium]|nr:four helix bundle protein [Candidatus Cloacimonadota bacterium]